MSDVPFYYHGRMDDTEECRQAYYEQMALYDQMQEDIMREEYERECAEKEFLEQEDTER